MGDLPYQDSPDYAEDYLKEEHHFDKDIIARDVPNAPIEPLASRPGSTKLARCGQSGRLSISTMMSVATH